MFVVMLVVMLMVTVVLIRFDAEIIATYSAERWMVWAVISTGWTPCCFTGRKRRRQRHLVYLPSHAVTE